MASSTKIVCLVLVCMVLGTVVPDVEGAITCGTVVSKLLPCLTYLKGGAGPSPQCCSGVKAVNALARTTPDRQTACGCIKTAAANYGVGSSATGLPSKCGVSIPYKISPSTDCSKVK